MSARKLQTEIDRTLKKVSEGVELFEGIYDKMQASTNQTQKEKLEMDLKTQIKRLQRMRDQIKTWVAGNEIKDKSVLLDNRKLIETQMEKFKACEKEMKTKAYSKAGLTQAAVLDPKEQEKEETAMWLRSQVESLQMQVEGAEAEIETLQGTGKKRNKSSALAGRQEELEHLNDRRKWHIGRLEILLRLLDNGSMPTEKVLDLKDDVQYFVENNSEEEFDEDEGIYDELNLDEEEEKFGLVGDDDDSSDSDGGSEDLPPRTPSKKHDEESVSSSKREESPILKKAPISLRKASVDAASKPPPNPNFAQQPMSSIVKAGLPTPAPRPPVTLPPIRYAAAAAAAVAPPSIAAATTPMPSTPSATQSTAVSPPTTSNPPPATPSIPPSTSTTIAASSSTYEQVSSSPSLTHPSVTSPMLSSATSVSHQHDGSFYSGQESPVLSDAIDGVTSSPTGKESRFTAPSTLDSTPQSNGQSSSMPPLQPSPLPQHAQGSAIAVAPPSSEPISATQQPQFPPGVKVSLQQHQIPAQQHQQTLALGSEPLLTPNTITTSSAIMLAAQQQLQQQALSVQRPPSTSQQLPVAQQQARGSAVAPTNMFPALSDLVLSFENAKQKAAHRMTNLDQVNKLLEGGYSSVPQPQDTEKPKYYVPRNPYHTAAYYPQSPNQLLSTPALFSQLDVETLFYVFYYLPGTYQQYLSAKELKRQSWRFHVKYLTWFQRHSEPQAITEEYEQGVYVYFDWEGSWCQRKKSDFRFEYRYLSED